MPTDAVFAFRPGHTTPANAVGAATRCSPASGLDGAAAWSGSSPPLVVHPGGPHGVAGGGGVRHTAALRQQDAMPRRLGAQPDRADDGAFG